MKTIPVAASFVLLVVFVGCAVATPPGQRLVRRDIAYAAEHRSAIVEAQVGVAERHAIGTRSEGYRYPLRVLSILLPAPANVSLSQTYDYRKAPFLRPSRYLLILQPGPYYRAERLSSGSARVAEVAQWAKHE